MKIAILSTHASKNAVGGVERFSAYLADALIGHEVTLLGIESLGRYQRALARLSRFVALQQPVFGCLLGKAAVRGGFDVAITNGMLGWNIQTLPVINVQHGTFARSADRIDAGRNFFKFFIKKYVWGYFEGLAARRAKHCIAVSEEVKESVERYYHARNVQVILNAVDTDYFKPLEKNACRQRMNLPLDHRIALFVGRFEVAKGKHILEGIQRRMEARGDILLVAEHYAQDELLVLYNAADIFLLPSLQEGCSYALLDAMSVGLPFLASPVGLVPALVDQGLFPECVVTEQTVDAYMQKMDLLCSLQPSQEAALRESIRGYILKAHTLSNFRSEYERVLETIHD